MTRAAIGLGANLGDAAGSVRAAIDDHPATGRPRIAYWMEWDGP